ncbi:unnamed protein product [Oikopleura dioica]|uniref:Condensin complex subunit 1 C-terminal domain-containing protein n=1 Tax=Oikopleura dioica TaxID=34765 RepID=E4YM94_OIKDI|nr:unnamed protein product [Oikopleura dioica]
MSALLLEANDLEVTKSQPVLVLFFGLLAKKRPETTALLIGTLEHVIAESNEKYWLCEACLSMMSQIYIHVTREEIKERNNCFEDVRRSQSNDSPDKIIRNGDNDFDVINVKSRSFGILVGHLHNKNALIRTFVLKLFTAILREVPLPHVGDFQDRIIQRFHDKSPLVRKCAVNTFISIIVNNQLVDQLKHISTLREQVASNCNPTTQKTIELLLADSETLLGHITSGSDIILTNYLNSSIASDVMFSINWFYQLTVIGIEHATLGGFQKMITHVWNLDKCIREFAICCFKDVFVSATSSDEHKTVALIHFVEKSNNAEAASIAKMVQTIKLSEGAREFIWDIAFCKEFGQIASSYQAAALALVAIVCYG